MRMLHAIQKSLFLAQLDSFKKVFRTGKVQLKFTKIFSASTSSEWPIVSRTFFMTIVVFCNVS